MVISCQHGIFYLNITLKIYFQGNIQIAGHTFWLILLLNSYCADLVAVPWKQVPSYSKCKGGWFSLKRSSLNPSAVFEIDLFCLFVSFLIIIFIHFDNKCIFPLSYKFPHPKTYYTWELHKTIPTDNDAFLRELPHF